MKNNLAVEPELMSDATLVEQSLAGDRDAFGQIVARYQSSICALAYSACGCVARSEDMAQEIFIVAWRKLGSLQEPGKFKAWLYGIARNLIHNAFRQQLRNPVARAEWLETETEPAADVDEPDEQAISKEEETILWHVLSGLPQIYREPMVLFYRENESIPQVAEVMAISEEAVRQRLSRGRALLNERVARVIVKGLRSSGPKEAFALSVVAALPLLAATTTAKGAIVGMATTKGASGPAGGLAMVLKGLSIFAAFLAIPTVVGTIFGHRLGRDSGGNAQQRRAAAIFWRIFGCGLLLLLFAPLILVFGVTGFLHGDARAEFLLVMTYWLGLAYPFVLGALIFWVILRRCRQTDLGSDSATASASSLPRENTEFQGGAKAETCDQILSTGVDIHSGTGKKAGRRWPLYLTIAAAGLMVFCLTDTNYHVVHLQPDGLRDLINQSTPGELRMSIMEGHEHSMFHEYPQMYRHFWMEATKGGKVTKYSGTVDDATLALIAKKGIACPTLISGRDYEILGTPGRMMPVLLAFVLGLGVIYLIQRRCSAGSGGKQAA